jgi:hypothetical protein
MAKKTTPIITHTEILSRAIRSIEGEIEGWEIQCEGLPQKEREVMFATATKELREKLETLKTLYRIETGADI